MLGFAFFSAFSLTVGAAAGAVLLLVSTLAAGSGEVPDFVVGGVSALGGGALVGWVVYYLLAKFIPQREADQKAERMQLSEQNAKDRQAFREELRAQGERTAALLTKLIEDHRAERRAFADRMETALAANTAVIRELVEEIRGHDAAGPARI